MKVDVKFSNKEVCIVINNELQIHFAWTVWHEGVRIYDDGLQSSYRDINKIRQASVSEQSHNPHFGKIIQSASNNQLVSLLPLITGRVFSEFNLPLHFTWVAYHEGALNSFRTAASEGRYLDIRSQYYSEQDHNPNARHLLAALSDQHIKMLVDDL